MQICFFRPNYNGPPTSSSNYYSQKVTLCDNWRKDFLNYSGYALLEHDRERGSLGPSSLQMNRRVRQHRALCPGLVTCHILGPFTGPLCALASSGHWKCGIVASADPSCHLWPQLMKEFTLRGAFSPVRQGHCSSHKKYLYFPSGTTCRGQGNQLLIQIFSHFFLCAPSILCKHPSTRGLTSAPASIFCSHWSSMIYYSEK